MADFNQLLKIEFEKRDSDWEREFLTEFPKGNLEIVDEQVKEGPDGMPYLFANTKSSGSEPVPQVLNWLSERGIGLVINPHKSFPDYVFPYGMVWYAVKTGKFLEIEHKDVDSGNVTLDFSDQKLAGEGTEEFFPKLVRNHLKNFLLAQGVYSPKYFVYWDKKRNHTEVCFETSSFGNPPDAEHEGILKALSWFFPAHYSLSLVNGEKIKGFEL